MEMGSTHRSPVLYNGLITKCLCVCDIERRTRVSYAQWGIPLSVVGIVPSSYGNKINSVKKSELRICSYYCKKSMCKHLTFTTLMCFFKEVLGGFFIIF